MIFFLGYRHSSTPLMSCLGAFSVSLLYSKFNSNTFHSQAFFSLVVKTHLGPVALLSFLCNSQHGADSRVSLSIPQDLDTSH